MNKLSIFKNRLIIFILILFANSCLAADLVRGENESAEQFIKRIIPDSFKVVHPIIETNIWDSKNKSIIALYCNINQSDSDIPEIFGHIYMRQENNEYRDIEFGPLEKGESGGEPPEVLSVFFANVDKDKEKELIVLCKYWAPHYDGTGNYYQTFIFDNPGIDDGQLAHLEDLSLLFWGCDCVSQESGKTEEAKYKNAQSIRNKLKQMRFN